MDNKITIQLGDTPATTHVFINGQEQGGIADMDVILNVMDGEIRAHVNLKVHPSFLKLTAKDAPATLTIESA